MAINVNINDTVHLRDDWSKTLVGIGGIVINIGDTVHLRDDLYRKIDAIGQNTLYIFDEIHLRDDITHSVIGGGGLTVNLSETVHLRDTLVRDVAIGGIWRHIFDEVHLRDDMEVSVVKNIFYTYNNNISFGETKEPGYKEYSHRFRWTNYNGIAVPDLNYKDLKEPIVRIIPAPSFLQFKYGNSFIIFTRNTINRFILKADVETGQWRAETDNLIEEFRDYGLMEAKTLVLAGETLFGLSEKGVWKWNKQGMDLISDKIIDLPDAGAYTYIAFYSSIRNQYILHRQESTGYYLQTSHGSEYGVGSMLRAEDVKTVMLDDSHFVMLHYDTIGAGFPADLYIIAGKIIDQTISYGTEVYIGSARNDIAMVKVDSGKVLLTYHLQTGAGQIRVANISGTTVTLGAESVVAFSDVDIKRIMMFTSSTFILFHNKTDYYTGSISGDVVTLNAEQSNWVSLNIFQMDVRQIASGIGIVAYSLQGGFGTAKAFKDNGDGTVTFGAAHSFPDAWNYFNYPDIEVFGEDTFVVAYGSWSPNQDMILKPFGFDSNTLILTPGTENRTAGWTYQGGGHGRLAIAKSGASSFLLFFENHADNEYLYVIYGTASATAVGLVTPTLEKLKSYADTNTIDAAYVVNGVVILSTDIESNTPQGYAQIFGVEYANIDSWVYQIDKKVWYKFLGMDILDVPVILSGGSLDENYNLWLNSDRELMKYPGSAYTAVETSIRTKEFYIEEGVFQRWMIDFDGSGVNVETRVKRMVSGSNVNKEDIKYSVSPNQWRGISLENQRGRTMSIKIIDATTISGFSMDIKRWGEK